MATIQAYQGSEGESVGAGATVTIGKWQVVIGKPRHAVPASQYRGWFEHGDDGEGGGLWFDGNMLADYDGVYEPPQDVIAGILALGFDIGDSA